MNRIVTILMKRYGLFIAFVMYLAVSQLTSHRPGLEIGRKFSFFFSEMMVFLPLLFILIGLLDVWVPRDKVAARIGPSSGLPGILWVILLAMLQAGPLYASFPVAALLWRKGCSLRNIFIYLGAFSCIKIPMLTFEISFLGLKFSLLRSLFSLPLFIAIACLLSFLLRQRPYSIREP